MTKRDRIRNALWQMYAHCQLENLEKIDGNDHPRLERLVEDLLSRLTDEGLAIERDWNE